MNIDHIKDSYAKNTSNIREDVVRCYDIWKRTEGLVNAKYARKVLGMSEDKFRNFCQTSRVPIVSKRFPSGRSVNLYPLKLLRDLAGKEPVEYIIKTMKTNEFRRIVRQEEWQRDLGDFERLKPEEKKGISLDKKDKLFCVKIKNKRKKTKRLYEALVAKERFLNERE